ncbi:hypothetical protein OAN96_01140 [Candidatus Gracilibacteria bacterium]|nr:hypothetical protein [Candidatus Gracilibacteria bacterium]
MISRIFQYAVQNIFRNTFLSFSSVLVLTLLMFFVNTLTALHGVSNNVIEGINQKLSLSLYLDDQYNQDSIEYSDLEDAISTAFPGVVIDYKDKIDVLEELREKDPELVKILEKTNPLPETISLSNIGLEQYSELNSIIESKSFILASNDSDDQYFANYQVQYDKINDVIQRLSLVQTGLYIIIAIFVVSIGIIIYSVIGNFVYYFKDEIYISRLVGGGREFIYGPFVVQGILYAIISFIFSLVVFVLVLKNINILFTAGYDLDYILSGQSLIFGLQALMFVLIGGLSGYISAKKYLK